MDGSSTTTIANRSASRVLVRIEVSPSSASAEATVAAHALVVATADPGYRQLGLGGAIVAGLQGMRWEYLMSERGVGLHRVETVFVGTDGTG